MSLFNRYEKLSDEFEEIKKNIEQEINRSRRDYILNVNSKEYCDYLINQYKIESIEIFYDEKYQVEPSETTKRVKHPIFNKEVNIPAAHYTIVIPFEGNGRLLHKRPSLTILTNTPEGYVDNNNLCLNFLIAENESPEREVNRALNIVKDYVKSINENISGFNNSLEKYIEYLIEKRKSHSLNIITKSQSINIPIKRRGDIPKTFSVPIPQKKIIKKIKKPAVTKKYIKPTPTIDFEVYEDILATCFDMSIVMERNPSTFNKLSEEEIRDNFIMHLNTYYKGETLGETFNKKGKTDILIRHEDKNLFISECKFWAGPKLLISTIDQLLKYSTWRDTKTAIFIFNKETQISTILKKVDPTIKKHANFCKSYVPTNANLKKRGIFNYRFNLPEDDESEIYLTVMIFNIPKL